MSFINRFLDWANHSLLDVDEPQQFLLGRGVSKDQWIRHTIGFTGGEFDVDSSLDPDHGSICDIFEEKRSWCDSCRYRLWSSTWESVESSSRKTQFVGKRIAGCIVLPLTSYSGTPVGFQLRSINDKVYDTFVVKKRPEGYFFGTSAAIDFIWSSREVWLVEGAFDHLIIERLISPNVLALTTNSVNKTQIKFLRRFVKKVNLCLDLDVAGRDGVKSFIRNNGLDFDVKDVKYKPSGFDAKDVGDIWKKIGDDKFKILMKKAMT